MHAAKRYLSTTTVARALGVSVTTVKRWVDEGVLPACKTAGGHRKVLVEDVLRLARRENWPQVDFALLGVPALASLDSDPARAADELLATLQAGDREGCLALLHNLHRAGLPVVRLADEVVAPAMRRLGHQWEGGEIDVWQEHRGTQTCLAALLNLQALLAPTARQDRPVALGGGPEGDHYLLANVLTRMTLAEQGWEAVNLGPNTPTASFRKALREFRPRLLWLSCSYLRDPEEFLAEYAALYAEAERRGVAVAVGGQALTDEVRRRMRYTTFGDSLAPLVSFVRTLGEGE